MVTLKSAVAGGVRIDNSGAAPVTEPSRDSVLSS